MSRVEKAVRVFIERDNCSQAILGTFGVEFGLTEEIALNLAKVFSGGIVRQGSYCGAVTASLMVIGLKFGNRQKESAQDEKDAYNHATHFLKEFELKNGSYICRDLIKFDLTTPENRKLARDTGIFKNCPNYVQDAAKILEDLFSNQNNR
ncbi:MAG: C-GCAxxG-C-C family protein [Candidatus Hodarchaeales archaeon]|jgi:C_GCAxxG_C_C family probable redox protein